MMIRKFNEVNKKTRYYGTDTPLFSSEINMLSAIKEFEGIHITGLAEKLGVTKGAVSQIVNKLQKKGLIKKEPDSQNPSKLIITLTPKGEIADANHTKFHCNLDVIIDKVLKNATEENKKFLIEFLSNLEKQIDNYEEIDSENQFN